MSLGETLAHQSNDPAAAKEAISIAERILRSNDVSLKEKSTTSANLLFLYLREEMYEDANALIRCLPHIWESREILMPEVYDNEEYADELKKCIIKVLAFLCQKIEAAPSHRRGITPAYVQLGVNFSPQKSTAEMLKQIGEFLGK